MRAVLHAREAAWLAWMVLRALVAEVLEELRLLVAPAGGGQVPWSVEEVGSSPARAAALVGSNKRVVRVTADKTRALASANGELGAGGLGTTRSWLELDFEDGTSLSVFVKQPAPRAPERLFLTVFGVYANEVSFYARLAADEEFRALLDPCPMAAVLCVRQRGPRFVLCLEDLAVTRKATFPTVRSPHPPEQVRAVLGALAALHATHWCRPPQGWGWSSAETRPPFLGLVADATLRDVLRRYPDLLTAAHARLYRKITDHHHSLRERWSQAKLTLVHGDAHLGNTFVTPDGAVGFYDFQCVAAEHPMRDVAYHLLSSADADDLAANEADYLGFYVDALNTRRPRDTPALSLHEARLEYRLHALYAFSTFVLCAGASDLFEESMARLTIGRITRALDRLDAEAALDGLVKATV